MTDGPITLGHAGEQPLDLDLDRLVGSHLGIVANAGGGKSGLIRKLLETTHGRIQHIVLDIEDEFYTLRQGYDYVIAGGETGDAPLTIEGAGSLARAALTHGFSLICQLNDLGGQGAREFVDAFLASMISAPRDLWRPCLVVIDEAQRYDTSSIQMLTERGRKRGFTAVLASQRLPKIDPNIRGDLNNWIMGRVGQSLDRRIMADQLGMSNAEARELAKVEPRHFWAMGPALSVDPVLFKVGEVETTMVRPGQAKVPTPPAPEALREILAGLAVAAKAGSEDTNSPAQNIPENIPASLKDWDTADLIDELDQRDPEWLKGHDEFQAAIKDRDSYKAKANYYEERVKAGIRALGVKPIDEIGRQLEDKRWADGLKPATISTVASPAPAQPKPQRVLPVTTGVEQGVTTGETALPAAAVKMLDMLDRMNPARVSWASLAGICGYRPRGGNFNSARKAMRESGRLIEEGDTVRSSAEAAGGMTREAARQLWKEVLLNPAPEMIDALQVRPMTRQALGDFMGKAARGGHFNSGVAQLLRNGVAVEFAGRLQLAQPLPGESH